MKGTAEWQSLNWENSKGAGNFSNFTYLYGSQIPNECKLNQIIKLSKNSYERLTKIINKLFDIKSRKKTDRQQEKKSEKFR